MSKVKVVESNSTGIHRHNKDVSDYYIFRMKDSSKASRVVDAANIIADNATHYYYGHSYPWGSKIVTADILKSGNIKDRHSLDCTGLVRACLSYACKVKSSSGFYPGVKRTDGHKCLTDKVGTYDLVYVGPTTTNKVKAGDILTYPKSASTSATNGHFRVAIEDEATNTNKDSTSTKQISANTGKKLVNRCVYPPSGNKYYYSTDINAFCPTYGPPGVYHNCTWYAYGRYAEIAGLSGKSNLPRGNAQDWLTNYSGKNIGSSPKVGAVVVWATNHVAVVEKIFDNGDFLTSNSAYTSGSPARKPTDEEASHQCSLSKTDRAAFPFFYTERVTKASGYYSSCGKPQGFIYQPGDFHSLGDDGSTGVGGIDGSVANMADRIEKLYTSGNYYYLDNETKKESLSYKLSHKVQELALKYLTKLIENAGDKATQTNVAIPDEVFSNEYLTKLVSKAVPEVTIKKVKSTFNRTLELIEAPFIELDLGGYIVGSYMSSLDDFPNHLSSIDVKKVNGEINSYTVNLTHLIRTGEDPNVIDKLLSKVRYSPISIRYGDCMSGVVYRDDKVYITNVAMSRDYHSNSINYTIYATSAATYVSTVKFNFTSKTDKPSNVIRDLLYQNVETAALLQEAFPGMVSSADVDSSGFLPNNDAVVEIPAQNNLSAVEYINYLTAIMCPLDSTLIGTVVDTATGVAKTLTKVNQVVNGVVNFGVQAVTEATKEVSTYFINYFTDHFEIKEVKKTQSTESKEVISLTNAIYDITIGYPDDNFVMDFSIDNNQSWSLLYEKGKVSSEYVYSINRDGIPTRTYSPTIANSVNVINQIESNWWKQVTSFPVSATLTLRGLLKPINVMDYVNIDVRFYGQSHLASGIYVVTGQQDVLSGAGFRTRLSLLRVSE